MRTLRLLIVANVLGKQIKKNGKSPAGKHLDLSREGSNGRSGKISDYKAKQSREVFVNYDTNEDGMYGDFQDTIDPEIEYIEADGVLMFHLDFQQNQEHHCTGLDFFNKKLWPADLAGRPMFLENCQDTQTFTPDIYPDTPEIEYLPMCNGAYGDCTQADDCCDVHRGMNWTTAVCKCREYGGDVATPSDLVQDQYMFDFIESIFDDRFNFSNPKFCKGGEANKGTNNCPFTQQGLTKSNWGQMIIWLGYNYDDAGEKWQLVNGTTLDLLYHYFGLTVADEEIGRKRRSLDEVNVNSEGEVTIIIENESTGGTNFDVLYNDERSPACIGVIYDVDHSSQEEKLQWRELDCLRAQNVMCEVDFRETGSCQFGAVPTDDWNYDELTKITSDPFGVDPDRCVNWEKCEKGEIITGTCDFDERFDRVLRRCLPAIAVSACNVNECANMTHVCNGDNMHCEDTIGTYACICNEGYRWQDGKDTPTTENPDGRSPTPDNNFWVYDIGSGGTDDPNQVGDGNHVAGTDSCIDEDECAIGPPPCPVNSACSNLDILTTGRMYECVCDAGYSPVYNLTTNGTDLQGAPYYDEVLSCEDVNECLTGTISCSGSTQCVNIIGSFYCGCNIGYLADAACEDCIADNNHLGDNSPTNLCDSESDGDCCENIDECDGININSCPVDANCIDNDGSYFCDCIPGYQMTVGTEPHCEDIDECGIEGSCHENATCVNTVGSYDCACIEGYEGNGEMCKKIDECIDITRVISMLATCTNTVAAYTCQCPDGYAISGTDCGAVCTEINECADGTDNCDVEATCSNIPLGSFTCTCNEGYVGTGVMGDCNDRTECANGK